MRGVGRSPDVRRQHRPCPEVFGRHRNLPQDPGLPGGPVVGAQERSVADGTEALQDCATWERHVETSLVKFVLQSLNLVVVSILVKKQLITCYCYRQFSQLCLQGFNALKLFNLSPSPCFDWAIGCRSELPDLPSYLQRCFAKKNCN